MLKDYENDVMFEEDDEMTEEEQIEEIRNNEDSLLERLLSAADYASNEEVTIDIRRPDGKDPTKFVDYFSFRVHPLSEDDLHQIRKKYTKYTRNRRNGGPKQAEELDVAKYKCSVIYNSTISEDQEKIWDNRKLWKGLERQGHVIVNALDVIETILLPGEKEKIMDALDKLGGYDEDTQIVDAKN